MSATTTIARPARRAPRARRGRRRLLRHHLPIAGLVVAGLAALMAVRQAPGNGTVEFRLSYATAWVSLALLTATLMLGPLRVLRGRRLPLSTDLRRDLGIWSGVLAVAHVVVGWQVHLTAAAWFRYLVFLPEQGSGLRTDRFGLANYTGLAATAVIVLLVALSSDAALRALGRRRWKSLHRLSYVLFALVIVHTVLYLAMERRGFPYFLLAGLTLGVVVALQSGGVAVRRRRAIRPGLPSGR